MNVDIFNMDHRCDPDEPKDQRESNRILVPIEDSQSRDDSGHQKQCAKDIEHVLGHPFVDDKEDDPQKDDQCDQRESHRR